MRCRATGHSTGRNFRRLLAASFLALLLAGTLLTTGWYQSRPSSVSGGVSGTDAVLHSLLAAVVHVESGAGGTGGLGILVDRDERLVVTPSPVVGDRADLLVSFWTSDSSEAVEPPVAGRVVFRDATRGLTLVCLESLPAGAAPLVLGDRAPEPGEELLSVHGWEPRSPAAHDLPCSYSRGKIRQVIMLPHY